jgi:DNA-binding GntR family transcriptional regulator
MDEGIREIVEYIRDNDDLTVEQAVRQYFNEVMRSVLREESDGMNEVERQRLIMKLELLV